ncbi:MAG: type II toxin-antitoxin system RelE/ParE family toxin [Phycisphaeraceae bacterium]
MIYRVVYTDAAHAQIRAQVAYFRRERVSGRTVDNWLNKLFDLMDSLCEWPKRFAVSERETAARKREIRKVNFGDYLVFYCVSDERQLVEIVGFRHGAKADEEHDPATE